LLKARRDILWSQSVHVGILAGRTNKREVAMKLFRQVKFFKDSVMAGYKERVSIKRRFYLLLLFLSLSFLLYGNTIRNGFVYDDSLFTYRNDIKHISSLPQTFFQPYLPNNPQSGVWRPVATITTTLQYIVTGESPVWFHITNIVLNGIATFLVVVVIYELFHQPSLAIIAGLLFTFFPIHTEAVAFIKSREDLFASIFFLLSWVSFLAAIRKKTQKKYLLIASCGFFILSVLSKETFMFAPLLFIVIYAVQHKISIKNIFQPGLYFVITFLVYMLARYVVLGIYAFGNDDAIFIINPIASADIPTRIWTAFQIAFIYLKTIIFPIHLSASYHFNQVPLIHNPFQSWGCVTGIILLIILMGFSLLKRYKKTPLGIGSIIFLISYFVISKFLFTAGEFMAERWMYIPSLGIALISAFIINILIKRQKVIGLLTLGIVIFWYASIIVPRNHIWFSEKTLYESMVHDAPQSVQAHYLLGSVYFDEKNYTLAKQEADRASSIYPNYAPVLTLQAGLSIRAERYIEAEKLLLEATRLDPSYFKAFVDLANIYYATEKYTEVVRYYEALVPKSLGRLNTIDFLVYATSLTKLGKYQKSINMIRENITNNNTPEVQFLLAVDYYKLGGTDLAKKYLNWDPNLTEEQKIEMIKSFH
jgi:protein O-mannosyl-transferase